MELTLESLRDLGGFTGAPVEREIKWVSGGEERVATVYVRPMSYLTAVADAYAVTFKGDVGAGRIAASICDKDGNPVFTPGDITGEANPERGPLNESLSLALFGAISEVNSLGKSKK